eukprot:10060172-Alexandrium_andersonii.AAC.1
MKREKLDVALLQETHKGGETQRITEGYTWYYSGGQDERTVVDGVAIVVRNELRNYIEVVVP